MGCSIPESSIKVSDENGKYVIKSENRDLLSYQYEMHYPPTGIDSVYKRSGYIHPLKTPSEKVLTNINPEDHWHHYGIWNPWTKVAFEGDTLDFWNLHGRQGTVRYAGTEELFQNDGSAGFKVKHEHVVINGGNEKVALNELQTVTVHVPQGNRYIIDFEMHYETATKSPFHILAHRYAGFGWRATEEWNESNSTVLTSAGNDRSTADGSLAEWVLVQGQLGGDYGGILLMGSSENEHHPEPIRVWPEGDVFLCMFPTKFEDWKLLPDTIYTLKYRMIIFDGEFTKRDAQDAWNEFRSATQYLH